MLALDIQKIEREKWLKRCQELKGIASPQNHKINMKKEIPTTNPKSPLSLETIDEA